MLLYCKYKTQTTTARLSKRFFQFEKEVLLYSSKKQTPVSMKSLLETGSGKLPGITYYKSEEIMKMLIQVACFLHRELPIRLAHRIIRLEESSIFATSGIVTYAI